MPAAKRAMRADGAARRRAARVVAVLAVVAATTTRAGVGKAVTGDRAMPRPAIPIAVNVPPRRSADRCSIRWAMKAGVRWKPPVRPPAALLPTARAANVRRVSAAAGIAVRRAIAVRAAMAVDVRSSAAASAADPDSGLMPTLPLA